MIDWEFNQSMIQSRCEAMTQTKYVYERLLHRNYLDFGFPYKEGHDDNEENKGNH